MQGGEEEYKGREYVEDESIVGNSEKVVFFTKEMIATLTKSPKLAIDPFLICKLDMNTINFFEFPKMKKPDNKFIG